MNVSVKITILRDLRPCCLLGIYRRFGETYCLYLQDGRIPWRRRQKLFRKSGKFFTNYMASPAV